MTKSFFIDDFSTYNDGVAYIYRPKYVEEDFSSPKDISAINEDDFVCKLDFEESSKREQDLDFAEQKDFSLSLKIRTRLVKAVDNKCKAVINNYIYDVSYVDKSRTEMWLYLEGVKPVGT